MTEPALIRIPIGETASLGLALVNRAAVGYTDAWQGPGRAVLPTVALDDYDALSITWQCQVTAATLNSTPNITTTPRAGTFCRVPGESIVVGDDTLELALGYFQDVHVADGLSAFLYENSSAECYFYFGFDEDNPPRAIGRVRLVSGTIGGETHTDLTATAPLPVIRRPDIEFGVTGDTRIVLGAA